MSAVVSAKARIHPLLVLVALTLGGVNVGHCDALYLKSRVINNGRPTQTPVPFPHAKIARYQNSVGFPTDCNVALKYPLLFETNPARCNPNSPNYDPPLMHRALYPVATLDGALFSLPEDISYSGNGQWSHWNLLGSQNQPGWVHVDGTGRYLQVAALSKHLVDDPLIGSYVFNDVKIYFRNSVNDGQSFTTPGGEFRPLIVNGPQYSAVHPLDAQNVNQHGATPPRVGFIGSSVGGDVLLPITITDGINHQNITSFSDAYVVRGKWNAAGTDLTWTQSAVAAVPAAWSTRGADEPAILDVDSTGKCMIVVRGSNQSNVRDPEQLSKHIAGHYWLFQSMDGCRTWSGPPTRWGYSDGTPFFSPAANSILFRSPRNNRVYWIGHISASNSDGNWPRTTLIAAEVDLQNPGIIKDTVTVVDKADFGRDDTDLVHINNGQLAMQVGGSAFVYLPRQDFGCADCSHEYSWYEIDVATVGSVQLSVAPGASLSHALSWSSSATDVVKWHVRRRYLSGAPLSDLWVEVGDLPGEAGSTTIAGYEAWQEAEYEVVAERSNGAALTSNRVIKRHPGWTGPRLSLEFPRENAAGDAVPRGEIWLRWTHAPTFAVQSYRLSRRYFAPNGSAGPWHVVGYIPASNRSVTLAGYLETDRFEMYLTAIGSLPQLQQSSNLLYIRFPSPSTPDTPTLARPY